MPRALPLALAIALVICLPARAAEPITGQPVAYQSIAQLQREMKTGQLTSEALVRAYLARIRALDRQGPALHALISLNPDALAQARALDLERRARGPRGALHGIPVLLKDNIETADRMPTTAGSLALVENFAPHDAPVAAALRAAGAIILGKTNLSEWANFRSNHSISGWTASGGLTRNPYVLDRTACGSSSGSAAAVAAGMAAASLGTETDGSITCPASMDGIVGLKPTLGLLPQQGIVPIAHSQDTAGPMARSVTEVALLLDALVGGAVPCAATATPCAKPDYLASLAPDALRSRRVGVLRFKAGSHPEMEIVYERALGRLRAAGAILVEVQTPDMAPIAAAEQTVLLNEFRSGLNAYLAATSRAVPTRDLGQLIAFDRASPYELQFFGQDVFEQAQDTRGPDDPQYQQALKESKRLAGAEGIDRLLREQQLELLVAPTTTAAWRVDRVNGDPNADAFTTLAAVAGYPHLSVPMGQVQGLPVGLSFIGPAASEPLLLGAGYAFERRTAGFVPPAFIPTLETDAVAAAAWSAHGAAATRAPR